MREHEEGGVKSLESPAQNGRLGMYGKQQIVNYITAAINRCVMCLSAYAQSTLIYYQYLQVLNLYYVYDLDDLHLKLR